MVTKDKKALLEAIKQRILTENICPKLAAGCKQLVFAEGSADSDIVFIGEAPGKNEDEQGLPFVGAAGKFLNEMLASINLKRSDVYITNIVKYRPPNNRDPLPEEKRAFWPFLVRQLEVIQPKLVVTLGRHSMEYFLPDMKISQVHGQPKRISWTSLQKRIGDYGVDAMQDATEQRTERYEKYSEGAAGAATQQRATSSGGVASSARKQADAAVVILPLYHPAAALYNGGQRQMLIDDFARIPAILQKITNG